MKKSMLLILISSIVCTLMLTTIVKYSFTLAAALSFISVVIVVGTVKMSQLSTAVILLILKNPAYSPFKWLISLAQSIKIIALMVVCYHFYTHIHEYSMGYRLMVLFIIITLGTFIISFIHALLLVKHESNGEI